MSIAHFSASFGRFWADRKETELLIEPELWREDLVAAEAASMQTPTRSLLVSGEHRVGKTTFLRLLAQRLEHEGWTVFEAGAPDLMAGQQWFGQLEGRIQRTVEELSSAKKLIWYIPDILLMARSGTHQGQAASVLDQILPAVVSGRLIVWTEATPTSTARLLQLRPTLRGLLETVRIEPQSQEEASELAQAWVRRLSNEADLQVDPDCVPVALSSARQYLSAAHFPGSVLDLIKLTVNRALKAGTERIESHEIVVTLSQLTGLPVSILDNKERVDLGSIRDYFTSRVIGQDEAVTAIVERIAMLKAGLNDPGKPIGVFLFAGSTGTGKTELAKTVAEYLFGSVERMIRLDMSEFQAAEATHKILGGDDTDSLINRVRKQPFSVVLLDEFEKSHASIWDLFLQVFDDGRLTDAMGHVADFRHCIIILTTNLGATSHRTSGLGFAPTADAFTDGQIMRAIGQTFRPEFQNRLDKVIVFRPLTRDLMREILKKELNRVLERRGLKYREWAVEWEATAQDFLLEKGFTPEMGARPLKRAIDQYLIAPLAATIVERRFPEGDQFVFIRSDGRAIQVDFVDPDSGAAGNPLTASNGAAERPIALSEMILTPSGSASELDALQSVHVGVARTLASTQWEDMKAGLAEQMGTADFWTRPDRHDTLARLALMDRVKAAAATADSLGGRLAKGTERTGKYSRELVGRLALQLHLLSEGIRDVMETAPIEVLLVVEPAFERPSDNEATRRWCGQVLGMYRAWAGNRHMQLSELAGGSPARPPLAADQRLRRPSPPVAGDRPARPRAGGRRQGPRPGGRAGEGRRRPAGRSSARQAPRRACRRAGARTAAARRRAPLPQPPLAPGAQHERQLAHRKARRRAARRLRPDRGEPGVDRALPILRKNGERESHPHIFDTCRAGVRPFQGMASSSAVASCRSRCSAAGLAAICTPIGTPVECIASGSDMAGVPMMLCGIVYCTGISNRSLIKVLQSVPGLER